MGMDGDTEWIDAGWFRYRAVGQQVWAIDGHGSVGYLVAGTERRLLIDTSWGVGDLPALVRSLSSLPLTVVNTHGHNDHTCGNYRFGEVYVHEDEVELFYRQGAPMDVREWLVDGVPRPLPPGFDLEAWSEQVLTWRAPIPQALLTVKDGHEFDLGGRKLEVILTPGHTCGSICLLDRKARILFTGDTAQPNGVVLHIPGALPLDDYVRSLQRLSACLEYDWVLPAHPKGAALPVPRAVLDGLLRAAQTVLDGQVAGCEEETPFGVAVRYRVGPFGIVCPASGTPH